MAIAINAQITLGGGTTTGGYPIASNWGYNYTQQIISKAKINALGAASITGLKFYLPATANIDKSNQWEVFIGHTTLSSFAGTTAASWIPTSAMSQVFTGTVTNVSGVVEVTFTTPFAYNNTDNLVIAVHENTPLFNAATDYFYTSASGTTNSSLYYRSDTTDFNLAAPVTAGGRDAILSNVTIMGLTPAVPQCPVVSAPAATATGVSVLPTFTWAVSNSASSYKISVGTTPGGTDVMNMQDVGNVTSYTLVSSLNFNTQYYYTVYAANVSGVSPACVERSFTTSATLGCTTVSAPTTAQTGLPIRTSFAWSAVSGALGYRLNIGTSAGASNVLSNFDLGNVTSYTLTVAQQLNPTTQYFYTIIPSNGSTVSTGCAERNFTTTIAPPANDECSGAISLTVNPSIACTVTTPGNTLGSTQSMAAGVCSGTPNDDVWYSFVATSTSHLIALSNIVSTGSTTGIDDMYMQVLSGGCGTLTSVLCTDSNEDIVNGLTPGQTYFIRVYTYASAVTANASFNICVRTVPPPPVNDNCANAVTLTVNSDMNCGAVTSGTTLGATSSGIALGACSGTVDDDVWYKFVASATSHTMQLKNIVSVGTASSTSLYAQVFSGDCSTLTSTRCISSNSSYTYLSGLTIGQTYYVRVYNFEANSGASIYSNSFDLCVGTLPSAPANDECSGVVNLTVSSTLVCASATTGTTLGATNSSVAVGTCTGAPDDDVWYSFTAVGTDHTILLSNVTAVGSSTSTSLYTQVFSGVCGVLTSVKCGTTNTTILNGLIPGQLYYVRVYNSNANTATALYANTFNICIGTPPPPPVNDNCSGALTLTVNPDYLCGAVTSGTTLSATASTGTAPSCGSSGTNDDVWFKFTATNTAHRVSLLNVSGTTDMGMAIYSGACGSLVQVMCSDPNVMNVTGLTVGQEYAVRVWTWASTATTTATFDICVGTLPPPPVNDICNNAILASPTIGTPYLTTQDATSATNSGGFMLACTTSSAGGMNDGVWYKLVGDGTTYTVSITPTGWDPQLDVYSGSCGSFVCVASSDIGSSGILETVQIGTVVGATYYVNVGHYSSTTDNSEGPFSIQISTNGVLGTSETAINKNTIKAYPNPFADVLNISDVKNVKSISIVDIAGRVVKTIEKPGSSLQLRELNSGMYIIILNMNDGSRQTIKAIKK